ncbi:phage terminase large subunit [Rhodovarius crocodyli]|uniref:phage terminase large subunit n=1 Tax=Rhodovarius crocodyli TaxID=1979269 RepID=UPI0013E3A3AF|nr:phage terminase large subunit [Rhodovarius crocodyli]
MSEREPVQLLRKLEREIGSDAFATQYLQAPAPPGGGMVKREWIKRYDTPPEPGTGLTYISWDTASKGGPDNSYSVGLAVQRVAKDRFYLLEVVRRRMQFPELLHAAQEMAARYPGAITLVEDTAVGPALVSSLGSTVNVQGIKPEGDKEARLSRVTALMERGELYLPFRAPWLEVFEAEFFSFPGSQHNDQVDALSQLLGYSIRDTYWIWHLPL